MFQHFAKLLFCFTLLLSAEQMLYASGEVVGNPLFDTEQVDADQHLGKNNVGFLLIDLSEHDYNPYRPDFFRLKTCYKYSVNNYQCGLNKRKGFSKTRCVSGKYNIPHHNQDKEDPDRFHLG